MVWSDADDAFCHVIDRVAAQHASTMAESTARDAEAAHRHVMLTELFGMHPRAIVDALVVHANEHLYLLGAKLEEQVRALLPADQAERDAEQGVHAITTLLENVIDYIMDAFELFCMDSVFVITPAQSRRMTLGHHRGLDLRGETHEQIPDTEHALRRRIASVRRTTHPGPRDTAPPRTGRAGGARPPAARRSRALRLCVFRRRGQAGARGRVAGRRGP